MWQQMILRWKDSALGGLWTLLPAEDRRRAEQILGQLIARAARREVTVGEQRPWEEEDDERRDR